MTELLFHPSTRRSEAQKILETFAGERCPCGHLRTRHRLPGGDFKGEVMGACRDCDCEGLIDLMNDEEEEE